MRPSVIELFIARSKDKVGRGIVLEEDFTVLLVELFGAPTQAILLANMNAIVGVDVPSRRVVNPNLIVASVVEKSVQGIRKYKRQKEQE